jgi:hypothetical protein
MRISVTIGWTLNTKPSHERVPTAPSKSRNPAPPISGNLSFCACQETRCPKAQKGQAFPTVSNHRTVLASPLESKNARFPTELRKAVTYYLVCGTRRPASRKCTEAQHFPPHLPAGESCLPCLSTGTPAPPLSDNLDSAAVRRLSCQGAHIPTSAWKWEKPCSPIKEWEHWILHWGKESCNQVLCRRHQKACSPRCREAQFITLCLTRGDPISPVQELKFQVLHWMSISSSAGLTRPAPTVHREPMLPTVTVGESL